MQRFRSVKTLQKFSSVHAQVHNHFNQARHLVTRQVYKQRRSAALVDGAPSRPNGRLGLGVPRHTQTIGRYYDKAPARPFSSGVTGRLGVRLLEFSQTRACWLETVAR